MKQHNEYTLREAIDRLISTYKLGDKINETRLYQNWEKAVGKLIARHTSDIKVKNRQLIVRISSAPLKQEMLYLKEQIKERINEQLGLDYIQEVVVR